MRPAAWPSPARRAHRRACCGAPLTNVVNAADGFPFCGGRRRSENRAPKASLDELQAKIKGGVGEAHADPWADYRLEGYARAAGVENGGRPDRGACTQSKLPVSETMSR